MTSLVTAPAPTNRRGSAAVRGSAASRPDRFSRVVSERESMSLPDAPVRSRSGRRGRLASGVESLGAYFDPTGRSREVIAVERGDGQVLVIDREELTLGDRRLVACLSRDEPSSNAALVCALYLDDRNRGRCRQVQPEDLIDLPAQAPEGVEPSSPGSSYASPLTACAEGGEEESVYSLEPVPVDRMVGELRWQMRSRANPDAPTRPVSLRHVVAAIESYGPVFERSLAALAVHRNDPKVSGTALRQELDRLRESPVVLNRGLREAVQAAVERGISMGEIALRCDRVKRDGHGNSSGETSWLARRIGAAPEGGGSRPTPWIHSEVLALIARDGLGIGPHEVEL